MIAAIDDVARSEGVWVEPAGGTVIASVRRLRESGTLRRSERVVVYLTGAGWKARDLPGPDPSGPARRPLLDPRAPDVGARVSALLPSAGPREGRAVSPEVIAW